MSRLSEIMDNVIAKNEETTIPDILTDAGVQDPAKRRSLTAQLTAEMKEGGQYHALRGTLIHPAKGGRGKGAAWTKGLEARDNKLPVVLRSDAGMPLRATMESDAKYLPTAIREQVMEVVDLNLTGKVGTIVAHAMKAVVQHSEHETVMREMTAKHAAEKEKVLQDSLAMAKQHFDQLVAVVKTQKTDEGAAQALKA